MSRNLFQDSTYLAQTQYKDSSNLGARINLHKKFTVADEDWTSWVFKRLNLKRGEVVLECGCGPGQLWRNNLEYIPPNCDVTLTDLSEGMVAEAKEALKHTDPDFYFQIANIEKLPFDNDSFDVVVANHMLYHVPDIEKAVAEVKRVMKPNGRFMAATNGQNHMKEIYELGQTLFADMPELDNTRLKKLEQEMLGFHLENGIDFLEDHFSQIDLHLYDSALEVTEPAPLIAYILSMNGVDQVPQAEILTKLTDYIENELTQKESIHISKSTGLFISRDKKEAL